MRRPGRRVFLLIGTYTTLDQDPIRRVPRLSLLPAAATREMNVIEPAQLALRDELVRLAHDTDAMLVDGTLTMCRDNRCRWATDDGMPIFRDSGHLNPDWATHYATYIDRTLFRDGVSSAAVMGAAQ